MDNAGRKEVPKNKLSDPQPTYEEEPLPCKPGKLRPLNPKLCLQPQTELNPDKLEPQSRST